MKAMPSRNTIRAFTEDGIYHVYNRGVEKRIVFLDENDYRIFVYYLYVYLAPLSAVVARYPNLPIRLQSNNMHGKVTLLAYCLMPNHFHLLIQNGKENTKEPEEIRSHVRSDLNISKFMHQLIIAYTAYFNKRYKRVGPLFQGKFKAVTIATDEQLLHVCRYIHLNPVVAGLVTNLTDYRWSNYEQYRLNTEGQFYNKDSILSHFSPTNSYETFVLDQVGYAKTLDTIKHLILEEDE